METQRITLLLSSGTVESHGTADLYEHPRANAYIKGGIALGVCWGLALIMLPVPIVHLIASPALFLFGPVVALLVYRFHVGAKNISNVDAKCPNCGTPVTFGPIADSWPLGTSCASCNARVTATRGAT